MKFSIYYFFSKYDQIRRKLVIVVIFQDPIYFNICYIILIGWTFYFLICKICKFVSTIVRDNGTAQFIFFLVKRSNINVA